MEVVHPRCAGLDVHKRVIVACRLTPGPRGYPVREVVSFRSTTAGLIELSAWLAAVTVAVVAMESTGTKQVGWHAKGRSSHNLQVRRLPRWPSSPGCRRDGRVMPHGWRARQRRRYSPLRYWPALSVKMDPALM